MTDGATTDVAIVGAGPAGAILAARLARRGLRVTVLERSPTWRWRAGGVFASPAAMAALDRAGVARPSLDRVARPIPAMRVETVDGTTARLTYGTEAGGRRRSGSTGRRSTRCCSTSPGGRRRGRHGGDGPDGPARGRSPGRAGRPRPPVGRGTGPPRRACRRRRGWRPFARRLAWPASPDRSACRRASASATTCPTPAATSHWTPGCASSRTATSGSPRSPAAGSTSASSWGQIWQRRLAGDGCASVARRSCGRSRRTDGDAAPVARGRPVRCGRRRLAARPSGDAARRPGLAPGRRCGRLPRPVHRRGPPSGARLGRAGRRGDRGAARRPRIAGASRAPTTGRCAAGSWPRTPCPGSSRPSSPARRLRVRDSPGRRPAPPFVRRWASSWATSSPPVAALDPRFLAALLAP